MNFAAAFLVSPDIAFTLAALLFAHLVPHTHWDREWYQPFVRFRQRLVALIDELLDDPPPSNESFLLDGQAIILDDYLEVRPEREDELAALLWTGRLEAGPWYVLADELIPSGEALVRNLLVGRRVLRQYHAESPPVLYCPDSFGHPATLPAIAAGFGLPLIVLWRGYGSNRWPRTDTFAWRAPDGRRVVTFHLPPNGYEFGADLPTNVMLARARWRRMRDVLEERALTGVVLIQNGADHHARQRSQREASEAMARAAANEGDALRPSSLRSFADDLLREVKKRELPEVTGELRDSYGYTWTLQGTFATRAAQKRRNAHAERLLVRDAEPWAALARQRGARSRLPLLVAAWRTLLEAHPHDTLCGCSIDDVATAMDRRIDDALAEGIGIRDDALSDLAGHDADAARESPGEWKPVVVVRNRAPRPRGGVAVVDIEQFVADVPVGPHSAVDPGDTISKRPARPRQLDGRRLQSLGRRDAYARLESARHYPDNDLVSITRAAVWLDRVPAYGIRAFPFGRSKSAEVQDGPTNPVIAEARSLDNGIVRVSVDDRERVILESGSNARRIVGLVALLDMEDHGDLYTPSIRGSASSPRLTRLSVPHRGPLFGEMRLDYRLDWPDAKGARRRNDSEVTLRLILTADSPLVRIHVDGVNRSRDHRLQLLVETDVRDPEVWADAAFGPVRRDRLVVPNGDRVMETPPATAPLHRYVSLFSDERGATLFSDGLAEYETESLGAILVTLVRAVGELSRNDIPERPGHAGWPAATPAAQSLGPYAARFALLLHGPRTPDVIDEIERSGDDALLPLEGRSLRSALSVPEPVDGVELVGAGLAFSSLKESEDGEWVAARCVNLLDQPVAGVWRFGARIREARYARLDESPLEPLAVTSDSVFFDAAARAIVTVLVR